MLGYALLNWCNCWDGYKMWLREKCCSRFGRSIVAFSVSCLVLVTGWPFTELCWRRMAWGWERLVLDRRLLVPRWNSMISVFSSGRPAMHSSLAMRPDDPRMDKNVFSCYSLTGILSQQTFDQTLCTRAEIFWQCKLSTSYLGEQSTMLCSMEGISAIGKC